MPLQGEYATEKTEWVAGQLAKIDNAGTTEAVDMNGMHIVVFTIRGRKTGKLRRVPLMRVEKDGAYALFASKGGAPEHPVWYRNVLANPDIDVQDGTQIRSGRARELSGTEREEWWARGVEAFPPYADYQEKTGRTIPVLLVETTG